MKTTIIPAQITTVEDKIAGNLSMNQLVILLFATLSSGALYLFLPPKTDFAWYKLPISLGTLAFFTILTIRIQNKTLLNWLIIIIRYNLRPKYYIYNKNHISYRNLHIPQTKQVSRRTKTKSHKPQPKTNINVTDALQFEHILTQNNLKPIFKPNPKGGLHVAFK